MSIQDDIKKCIDQNDLYSIRDVVPESWKEAFELYLPMAKLGDAKAQFNLGYMYARGDIMERDFSKAFEWYQKAAENSDPRAHFNLSQMYERGEFVLPDNIKAKEHLKLAIELGDERAKNKTALANAKNALKKGDRENARALFASVSGGNKEAEMGIIACSAIFKSLYNVRIKYSYHSSGPDRNKKFWKWGEAIITEVDLNMTNQSSHSWHVMVKGLIRAGDGFVHISTFGGTLKANETQSNVIDPEKFAGHNICGVAVYSDREGSPDKPIYSFHFPDVPVEPAEEERRNLSHLILAAKNEMEQHNKTAKPSGCFVLTACYGSYDAPTVMAFRQFRDNHLSQYKLGRRFIGWYYTHGPKWAEAIENAPKIKAIFRLIFNLLAKILPR